jgi:hypothetical protein
MPVHDDEDSNNNDNPTSGGGNRDCRLVRIVPPRMHSGAIGARDRQAAAQVIIKYHIQ